ncbi:MAG: DUF7577 domain-containing protein, partial [Halobacteriota archaeon]
GWVLAYGVGLLLLQLLVYRYLWSHDDSIVDTRGPEFGSDGSRREAVDDGGSSDAVMGDLPASMYVSGYPDVTPARRLCPYCGVENEPAPMFVFCRNCVQRLG